MGELRERYLMGLKSGAKKVASSGVAKAVKKKATSAPARAVGKAVAKATGVSVLKKALMRKKK